MTQTQKAETDEQADEKIHVETGGDLWRSTTDLLDVLVDECKVRFDASNDSEANVHVRAVDPANVGMISLSIPAEAFDAYHVEEDHVLGLPLSDLSSVTSYARKGGNSEENPGDPVILEQVGRRIYVRVEPDDRMTRTGSFFSIDPDSIRQEPDLPDLSLPWEGDVDATEFRDALKEIKKRFDHARISAAVEETGNGSLSTNPQGYLSLYAANVGERKPAGSSSTEKYVETEDEFRTREKVMEGEQGQEDAASLFSLDYLKDMAQGLVSAGFETVTLRFGDEFPLRMEFEESRWGISGEFMLAPRISSSDDDSRATLSDGPTWGDRFDSTDDEEASSVDEDESDAEDDGEDTRADGGDETDEEGDLPGCKSGDCENTASEEAVEDGYPFCSDHDTAENRDLYDELPEETFEEDE